VFVSTRREVEKLLEQGMSGAQIARALGISKSTVAYHRRRLGHPVDERCNRRYDWAEIQRYYDAGHSITECQLRFGFNRQTWHAARQRGQVRSRPQALPLAQLLVKGVKRGRFNVKSRLIAAGLKEDRCELCGLDTWRGRPLAMALHHVNGDVLDNRLENLRLLCPNCHSQTENFSGRNRRAKRAASAEVVTAHLRSV
jgi:DNA-binding transcriptional ArsR family regulator